MADEMNSRASSCLATLNLASLVHPIFGNGSSVKCVVNEHGDTFFVKDASLLLQLLDIEHPVGQLIVSVCSSHSHRYGCGVKSLLVMLGQLTDTYLTLHDMGIPGEVVITLMRRVLRDCEQMLKELQIPLSNPPIHSTNTPDDRCLSHTTDSGFYETTALRDVQQTENQLFVNSSESKQGLLMETKFVHLKMKDEDEDADEDDIDWFFDRSSPGSGIKEMDSVSDAVEHIHRNLDHLGLICSLKDTNQHDSDFEDCFDEGLTEQNIKLSVDVCEVLDHDFVEALTDKFRETQYTEQEATMIKSGLFGNEFKEANEHETFLEKIIKVSDDQNFDINQYTEPKVSKGEFDSCFDDCDAREKLQSHSAVIKFKTKNDPVTVTKRTEECFNILKDSVRKADRPGILLSSRHLKHDTLSYVPQTSHFKDQKENTVTLGGEQEKTGNPLKNKDLELSNNKFSRPAIDKMNEMLFEVKKKKKSLDAVVENSVSWTKISNPLPPQKSSNLSLQKVNDMLETLNQTKKTMSHTKLLNSSRHFKTIESSVAAMKQSKNTESSFSDISEFEQSVHERLAEKKKQCLNASLSHSRHFKSFDNVTISGLKFDLKLSDRVIQQPGLSILESKPQQQSTAILIRSDYNHDERKRRDLLPKESANSESGKRILKKDHVLQKDSKNNTSQECLLSTLGMEDQLSSICPSHCVKKGTVSLHDAAKGLSHGCGTMMKLVVQAADTQMLKTGLNQLNVRLIHTCTVTGPAPKHTTVVPGLVFKCETDVVSCIISSNRKHWNTVLVNGDLSHSYHHHGYKTAAKGSHVLGLDSLSKPGVLEDWLHDCQQVLQQFSVDLILVRGQADSKVKDSLLSMGILTMEKVPFRVLEAVRETTGTELTVYVTDCNVRHVCKGLTVQPYSSDWCDKITRREKQTTHVVVDTPTSSTWQTLVLCHPSSLALDVQEQEVQVCSHRLTNALHDGTVLPGAGFTERICSQYLSRTFAGNQNPDTTNDFGLYQPVVMEKMAGMFSKIVCLVNINKSLSLTKDTNQLVCCPGLTGKDSFCENEIYIQDHSKRTVDKNMFDECYPPHVCEICDSRDCSFAGTTCSNTQVFDNYSTKMAAWSAAMDTVAMVTQTDAQIVTGVTSDDLRKTGVFINGIIL